MPISNEDIEIYRQFQKSPIFFIEKQWRLKPQPIKEEYINKVNLLLLERNYSEIQKDYFDKFEKGKHITWQQWLILLQIENALAHKGKSKISVVSGHGIGKDATISMLIIWFLFCFKDAQIPCTAPTSELMHDVLWKELKLWLDRMPPQIAALYEWSTGYLRIKERPETWFARARTAKKEAPEALQGVHGDYVLIISDEASGVVDEIYRAAEGSLTGENVLVVMISNGTRNEGYFYDSHHTDAHNWENLQFSSEDSPIVKPAFIEGIEEKYGRDSDEFKIRVSGGFPNSEQMDEKGWIPIILDNQVTVMHNDFPFLSKKKMGIDPAGGGDDLTVWVVRDKFIAKVVAVEKFSNTLGIARKTVELMELYDIDDCDVYLDNFGEGANVAKELALMPKRYNINALNWAVEADDDSTYLNKRAECYFRTRDWLVKGGIINNEELKKEIVKIKYKSNLRGKKQIMDKPTMRKVVGKSPDRSDALGLTFVDADELLMSREERSLIDQEDQSNDPYSQFLEI